MLPAVFTICGVAHLWFGRRAFARARSRIELLYATCILSIGVMALLWPVRNAIFFDHLAHITGLSLLLRYLGLTLGLVCGFASLSALIEGWSWWHRAALVVYAALLLVLGAVWGVARDAAASDPTRLLYGGYYGRPLPLLAWNILVGVTIVYSCALLMLEMARAPHAAHDREARIAMRVVSGVLFAFGVGGALMIAGQALASRLGFGATHVVLVLNATTAVALTAVPILNTWSFYLLPLWRVLALRREVRTLRRTRQDLVRLLMLLSDRLVHFVEHADLAIVQAVAVRTHSHRLQPYHLTVVLEAARWITFRRAVIGRQSWSDIDTTTRKTVDEIIVKDAVRRSRAHPYLYTDVYLVVILVLGVQYVPDWLPLERDPQEWHYALAALITDALAERHNTAGGIFRVQSSHGERHRRTAGITWPSVRQWFVLLVARQERTRIVDDLTTLRALYDDLLIYLRDQSVPPVIRAVGELCHARHVALDQDHVAREAARWVGFFLPGMARGPWEETSVVMGRPAGVIADNTPPGMQRIRLLANTSRIVLLVLRPEYIPMGIRSAHESARWCRRIARLIGAAVGASADEGMDTDMAVTTAVRSEADVGERGMGYIACSRHGYVKPDAR